MDYWQRVLALQARVPLAAVAAQVAAMTRFRQALADRRLPATPLPRLGIDASLYAQALLAGVAEADIRALDALLRNFRQYLAYHYGMWASVTQQLFATWQQLFGPLRYLEVAAGNGYLSAGLRAPGRQAQIGRASWRAGA